MPKFYADDYFLCIGYTFSISFISFWQSKEFVALPKGNKKKKRKELCFEERIQGEINCLQNFFLSKL